MAIYAVTKLPTGVDDMSGGNWSNKDNVKVKDGAYAVASSPAAYYHRSLDLYNFGFNIPSTATITQFTYEVKWKVSTQASICALYGLIYKNNRVSGVEMWDVSEPLIDTIKVKTNSNSVLKLTPEILNSAEKNVFKIFIQFQHANSPKAFTVYLDYVSATVTYEDAGLPPSTETPLTLTATQVGDVIKLIWS